ncbi:hypothetical protein GGI04_004555 [Coemansia thaxteri]|nr:hypothetical protein GGI04_004555 [Coemansia thaxteri]KAJ2470144.1 hypothetical protein GGI02_003121 [Coemansia sp. RSA 2322]
MASLALTSAAAALAPACDGTVALKDLHRRACGDCMEAPGTTLKDACGRAAPAPDLSQAWWLSSDGEHAHTACPLRPFAHMVVALAEGGGGGGTRRGSSAALGLRQTGEARVEHVAEALTAQQLAQARVVHVSDALRRKFHSLAVGAVVGQAVGDVLRLGGAGADAATRSSGLWGVLGWLVGGGSVDPEPARGGAVGRRPWRRRSVARSPSDDPQLVGNEGLGGVEVARVRGARAECVFAMCAHTLAPATQAEWLTWHGTRSAEGPLAVVHVAEATTLHRVACGGLRAVVPAPGTDSAARTDYADPAAAHGPGERGMALLVSRHGLVEMAHPLRHTVLTGGARVALGAVLGESLFSRVHPDDVARVVKALRLAWDARPDVYYAARLRRRAASGSAPPARQVLRADAIEVANGVASLTVQLQISGAPGTVDWACAASTAALTCFAAMNLTRWPLVLRPPRDADEPRDGFVLAALEPLPEPTRREPPPPRAATEPPASTKLSISSVASAATLALDAAELRHLCRSASSMSCTDDGDATARPSLDAVPSRAAAVPIPLAEPRASTRRRSSIAPASLRRDAEIAAAFGTPRELAC